MNISELKEYLDFKVDQYNRPNFIESDPIQICHQFTRKEDIEITGFLVSTIAWGNRKSIINNGMKLCEIMNNQPHEFVLNYSKKDSLDFVHRTFNGIDLDFFFRSLNEIYSSGDGLEACFCTNGEYEGIKGRIISFRMRMLQTPHEKRSEKHLSNPLTNSAAKRLNMYLRWMVRNDNRGVDFGIWNKIKPSELVLPLDVHTGNIARRLGILSRKQNDWRSLDEIMTVLRTFDPNDPVKYDYALFGIGAFEKEKVIT